MIRQITTTLYDQLIADFELRSILSASSEPTEVIQLRQAAFEHFRRLGFPSTKVEDWKYLNLSGFLKDQFITSPGEAPLSVDEGVITQARIPGLAACQLVMVNGRFEPGLSDELPGGDILVSALSAAMDLPGFKTNFGQHINLERNHFAAANTALFNDGLYIEIKDKAIIDKPLHIIHVSTSMEPVFMQPRQLILIGANANVSIAESFISIAGDAPIFVNHAAEIVVGEQASLQHYYIQSGLENTRYIHHAEIVQRPKSMYYNYRASFPGIALLRNNLNISLAGQHIETHLYGIYLAGGKQLVDNHTVVDHLQPNCHSNELYKGVMKDKAVAVFNGKIMVRKDAQKTNAFQKNNNLMLSKTAVVDSKPQLEIFADDVKCSHGSTIGQFNEDALFYLKARGIGEEKAKALLIHAFAFDVTEKIPDPALQAYINHLIEAGLG